MIETRLLYKLLEMLKEIIPGYYKYKDADDDGTFLDDDVVEEQKRVVTFDSYNDAMKVYNLKKKFRKLKAVKDICFGVKPGECFGLLGINGAGKTTTFRIEL